MLRRRLRPLALATVMAALLASAGRGLAAQESATLIADRLEIAADSQLIADGGVEVLYQGRRLTAQRIVYDQMTDRLRIEGPIRMTDETGANVIIAAQADLAADLTEGILQSARIVMEQQLQMAAAEMRRSGGRYLQLDNAIASSCRVCAGSSTPLWEIRSRRILHDQQERQIYFDHAQLRVGGVPILYVPRLRMPDPSLSRSTGFLQPTFSSRTGLGFGVTVPYFVTLGQSRDLTFSPTITAAGGRSLGLRYRQAFDTGTIELTGALSRDRIEPGEMRGYLVADGSFQLRDGFRLAFHGETVSDEAYLADYAISSTDTLVNSVQVDRVRGKDYTEARIVNYDYLREGDLPSATPAWMSDTTYVRRFQLGALGGEGNLRFGTHTHTRESSNGLDSASDVDDVAEGADMQRISLGVDWRRDWVTTGGIVAAVLGEARLDSFRVTDDVTYGGQKERSFAAGAVELRWPWVRSDAGGVTQVIEPIAQFVWSGTSTSSPIPNEDSRLAEFDEANLFSLNRFAGSDAVETGRRVNLGLSWTRIAPDGWTIGVTAGRIFRSGDETGLNRALASDWLLAATVESASGLALAGRMIADDDLTVTRGEVQVDYGARRYSLNSAYIWSIADPFENRPDKVSDLVVGGAYQISPWWSATASGRYDFEGDSYRSADFGLTYRNECLSVDLSLSRRFTSSTSVRPATTVDLSFQLLGFGGSTAAGPAHACR